MNLWWINESYDDEHCSVLISSSDPCLDLLLTCQCEVWWAIAGEIGDKTFKWPSGLVWPSGDKIEEADTHWQGHGVTLLNPQQDSGAVFSCNHHLKNFPFQKIVVHRTIVQLSAPKGNLLCQTWRSICRHREYKLERNSRYVRHMKLKLHLVLVLVLVLVQ